MNRLGNRTHTMIITLIIALVALATTGCSQDHDLQSYEWQEASWETTLQAAKGSTVNIHMWGGSDQVNQYMDQYVATQVLTRYQVKLNRVPITDARDLVNKLRTEKDLEKEDGSVDIFWLNGENFAIAKNEGLLLGNFVDKLPNYNALIDKTADDLRYDFGTPTEGLEAPWGRSQFVLIYDETTTPQPPKTFEDLLTYAKKNPGMVTYPAPPDFTGSAFVRQVIMAHTADPIALLTIQDTTSIEQLSMGGLDYLEDLKPYLWRQGTTYPESSGKLDTMFGAGEVHFSMSYNPVHASNMITSGNFPETTRSFILDSGSLTNTHYLTIPFNAANPPGAQVVIDFLLSEDAQIEKYKPSVWGDGFVIDTSLMSPEGAEAIGQMDRGIATLPADQLEENKIPEMPGANVELLEDMWYERIAVQ